MYLLNVNIYKFIKLHQITWTNCFYSTGNTIEDDEFSVSTLLEKANANLGMFISTAAVMQYRFQNDKTSSLVKLSFQQQVQRTRQSFYM